MGSILVVGGDRVKHITTRLENEGYNEVIHLDGRKANMVKRDIPEHIRFVLVITDFINHNLAKVIKEKAKKSAKPIYFVHHSWSAIYRVIQKMD
ncbi:MULTISPECIES: DUF2325 domain-containing protein [Priestia]|jgi:hypothetical protein|uniref:Dihydroorotate dehydrogenase n=3 Tax=Priestia TaxID=2800373 RepID=A0A0H4L1F9_9BACI|nr:MULTISPECIES: DUF2325 domain-containing protein [Priestia]AKO94508.1 dihydroorotate dehydrogenase [Priestia filamentosa]KAB2490414.1 DUF2325 domain-containing protein [Priestia endophytica]KYG30636.1 dihydroorotate dehydrogenase [Priestia endophytica]MBG9813622.1 dihydroorotate dehydrogenase [Priestia endophytica]MCM3540013.1 DUF2325 domain-containing protein [Priestia endophytica]